MEKFQLSRHFRFPWPVNVSPLNSTFLFYKQVNGTHWLVGGGKLYGSSPPLADIVLFGLSLSDFLSMFLKRVC